jgi:hypothetical protein
VVGGIFVPQPENESRYSLLHVNEVGIRKSVHYCGEHGGIGGFYMCSASKVIYDGEPTASCRIMLDEYPNGIER